VPNASKVWLTVKRKAPAREPEDGETVARYEPLTMSARTAWPGCIAQGRRACHWASAG